MKKILLGAAACVVFAAPAFAADHAGADLHQGSGV